MPEAGMPWAANLDELRAAAADSTRDGIRDDELHDLVAALVAGRSWADAVKLCPNVDASVLDGWRAEVERLAALASPWWSDLGPSMTTTTAPKQEG